MFFSPLNANLLTISCGQDYSRDPSAAREMTSEPGIPEANKAQKWSAETIGGFVILQSTDAESSVPEA